LYIWAQISRELQNLAKSLSEYYGVDTKHVRWGGILQVLEIVTKDVKIRECWTCKLYCSFYWFFMYFLSAVYCFFGPWYSWHSLQRYTTGYGWQKPWTCYCFSWANSSKKHNSFVPCYSSSSGKCILQAQCIASVGKSY
jgi:hypothetical protein